MLGCSVGNKAERLDKYQWIKYNSQLNSKYIMLNIVLFQPEIPQNTGNIIRLCANTGTVLHLIKPLGFPWDSSKLKRAGLDYHEFVDVILHESWQDCLTHLGNRRIFALSTKGHTRYDQAIIQDEDVFVFGPETRGLPADILASLKESHKLRLPMLAESRSMNLSNTVAVMLFEAWRQLDFFNNN